MPLLLLRPRIRPQTPTFLPQPPGPEDTPMDESKSLKRPHMSDSDSDSDNNRDVLAFTRSPTFLTPVLKKMPLLLRLNQQVILY